MRKNFQKHETPEDKERRKNKYWLLINVRKYTSDKARRIRDWTDPKVRMIIDFEANPI